MVVVLGFYVSPTAKVIRRPRFKVSSGRLEKPGIELTTPGLESKWLNHYTREASTIRVTKTKALISFTVTAKLICVFVFAYAKNGFLTTGLKCKLNDQELVHAIRTKVDIY